MRQSGLIGAARERMTAYDPPGPREAGGSGWSLDQLYRTQAPRLLRFFARRAGRDDAGDLVHEAFARLAGLSAERAGAIDRPEAYLGRMATNLLRDRARLAARQALLRGSLEDVGSTGGLDPQSGLEDRDALAHVERALSAMNPRRRRIFLLHRLEGRTYAEIATEVGLSVKGVKKQMAKALVELRRATSEGA